MKEQFSHSNKNESHAEKREFLYEKLEEKVFSILELRSFAKNHEKDSYDDLEAHVRLRKQKLLDEYFSKGFITLEEKGKLASYPELIREGEELSAFLMEKEKEVTETSSSEQEYNEKRAQYQKEEKRLEEINTELMSDDPNIDTLFLKRTGFFLEGIVRKKLMVSEAEQTYKQSPKDFHKIVKQQCELNLDTLKDTYKVSFPGYSIVIELSEMDFNTWMKRRDTNGAHVHGSAFIILKDREGKEQTLNHEENHNLTESFVPEVEYAGTFAQRIKTILETNTAMEIEINRRFPNAADQDKEEVNKARQFVRDGLRKMIDNYTFENFSEIIADIDRLGDKEINTYLWNYIDSIDKVEEIAETTSNTEMKTILEEGLRTSRVQFVNYINKLSNIFFVSEKLGELDQAKAAIILFKHGQINKVEKYLQHHFGEEKYNAYKSLQPLMSGGVYFQDIEKTYKLLMDIQFTGLEGKTDIDIKDFNLKATQQLLSDITEKNGLPAFLRIDNLRNLALSVRDNTVSLTDQEKAELRERILKINWLESVIFNKYKASDLGEIDTYLKEIGEHLGIDEFENITEEKIGADLLATEVFMSYSKKNYDELYKAYNEWPFGKNMFQFSFVIPFITMEKFAKEWLVNDSNFIAFLDKIDLNARIREIILGQYKGKGDSKN